MASYEEFLEQWAAEHGSDGCTHASDRLARVCCLEHDFAYVHGFTVRGVLITKWQADQRFRDCCAAHSPLRWLSPWAWLRWLAVSRFGHGIWKPPLGVLQTPLLPEVRAVNAVRLAEAQATRARMARHP